MKYDTIIIGGGLSGLCCALALTEKGQKCAVINKGQGVLSFWSGSFDLLNKLPNGTAVHNHEEAYPLLEILSPKHPYCHLGKTAFLTYRQQIYDFITQNLQLNMVGKLTENSEKIALLGSAQPTWLSMESVLHAQDIHTGKILVVGIDGFFDFHAALIAANLAAQQTDVSHTNIMLPVLEMIRQNSSEYRATNLARVLETPQGRESLLSALKEVLIRQPADLLILPNCLGIEYQTHHWLEQQLQCQVKLIATTPPSLYGLIMQMRLSEKLKQAQVTVMQGDTVNGYCLDKHRITSIQTINHGDIKLYADNYVLATGSFISGGLDSTYNHIDEKIFQIDVAYDPACHQWVNKDFWQNQPYMNYGIQIDRQFHCLKDHDVLDNVFGIGSILAGSDALQLGCGGGVAMMSALYVADNIG